MSIAAALPPQPAEAAIVITGKALPEAKSERIYDVVRISRQMIEQSPAHQLDQLLKLVPGLELYRRSDSTSGHPTSQGVTLRALGGNASSRALLILDGVPQSDPFGGWVNWPAYDPADLSEIRIIRGGGSVANGPGALAGTIEMTSRSDSGTTGEVDAGSRSSFEERARLGFGLAGGLLSISGRASQSNGFVPITAATRGPADERAPYHEWTSRGRWVAPIASTTEIQANVDGFHDWRSRGTDFSANRTDGADASLRLVGRGSWQWSALGYWQWRNLMSDFANVSPGRATASLVSQQYSVPSNAVGGSLEVRPPMPSTIELRLGADGRRTEGESREFYSFVDGAPTRRRNAGGESWTAGAFAEGSVDLGRMTLTAGGRMDHWEIGSGHLFEELIASGSTLTDERDQARGGWLPTARGGITIPLGGFSLRSAAYLGWRMPTLNELFRPFRAGLDATAANPALDPEKLSGIEAGIDHVRGPLTLRLTAFANRLKDAIANVTLGKGPGIFPGVGFVAAGGTYYQRENVDSVKVRGLEASASWKKGPWFVDAGASLTHARMEASGAAQFLNGLRPAQTPRFSGTFAFGWEENGLSGEVVVRRVGAEFDNDLNTNVLKPATTLDAFAAYPVAPRVQIVLRAENLTNALVMAAVNGDGSIERATPRTLWIGVRLN